MAKAQHGWQDKVRERASKRLQPLSSAVITALPFLSHYKGLLQEIAEVSSIIQFISRASGCPAAGGFFSFSYLLLQLLSLSCFKFESTREKSNNAAFLSTAVLGTETDFTGWLASSEPRTCQTRESSWFS